MFTENDIIRYYDLTEIHYKRSWKLDKCLAMHYGYADEKNKGFEKSLINMNKQLAIRANITKDDYVLDAGCGVGGSSIYLSKFIKCKTHGITIVEKQVETAKINAIKANVQDKSDFSNQSYLNTNFADNTFDVVWAIESICHAPDKDVFFKEAFRVLKPGGRIMVSDYIKEEDLNSEGQLLIDKWIHTWAIDNIASEKEKLFFLRDFSNVVIEDLSEFIKPSAKYMYKLHYLSYIFHRIYDLLFGVSKESEENFQSAKYQYQTLKKGYWKYKVFTAVK